MQRETPSQASLIYDTWAANVLAKAAIKEDRHLPRKRALESLDLSLLEYMSFAMPSGFKDWVPDVENIKKLEPNQKMVGFMSYNGVGISGSNKKGVWHHFQSNSDEDIEDEERESLSIWQPTSLLRLARLGIVTPMASSSGLFKHNLRCVYAGLIDGFIKPVVTNSKFAVCSFKLPDWRQVLAENYRNDLRSLVGEHNMLLQDMCYDKTSPEYTSLENRLDALKVFLKGSLSWMLLDLPIGGGSNNRDIFKFDYAFSFQLRRVIGHIETVLHGSSSVVEHCKGGGRWYGQADIENYKGVVPIAYSGLHGNLEKLANNTLTCKEADMRRAILLALLYPGLLADHGVVSAYVMAKSRQDAGGGVADVKIAGIRDVDRSMQETIWMNEVTMSVNPYITPNVFNGTLELNNARVPGNKAIPIDLMTPTRVDHQEVVDSIFGAGYARMTTSRRIGAEVMQAIHEVMRCANVRELSSVYEKWRDKLNDISPVIEHKPGGGDQVLNTLKYQETISLAPPAPVEPLISTASETTNEDTSASK